MTRDRKTSANGLFHFAMSYHRAAVALALNDECYPFKDTPAVYLFNHAFELYLKAFLRHVGVGPTDLRRVHGHSLRSTLQACRDRGLPDVRSVRFCARLLDDGKVTTRYRYIEYGTTMQPALATLNQACEGLRDHIHAELKAAGERVHAPAVFFGGHAGSVPDRWRLFAHDHRAPRMPDGLKPSSSTS